MPSLVWKTNEEDDLDDLDGAVKKWTFLLRRI